MSVQCVIDTEGLEFTNRNGSRYNAVTHGLTAKTAVLPGEDPEAFQAKVDLFKSDMETRTPLEDELAEKAALASWQLERANHAEVARLNRDMLTKPAARALGVELEAVALGQRLFFDRRGPTELYPSRDYDNQQARTSWDDVPDDPDHPARLIPQLEATLAGCRLLLKFWSELRGVLDMGLCWQSQADRGARDPRRTENEGDGGARDTRRTTDGVPLTADAERERANRQNEIAEEIAGRTPDGDCGPVTGLQVGAGDRAAGRSGRTQGSKREERRMRREAWRRELQRPGERMQKDVGAPIGGLEASAPSLDAIPRLNLPRSP
jgi:hypothetical protein